MTIPFQSGWNESIPFQQEWNECIPSQSLNSGQWGFAAWAKVHGKHQKRSREALEDQVEGCDVEKVKPEPLEFEDDEFRKDKKSLNVQGKGVGTIFFVVLKLFGTSQG